MVTPNHGTEVVSQRFGVTFFWCFGHQNRSNLVKSYYHGDVLPFWGLLYYSCGYKKKLFSSAGIDLPEANPTKTLYSLSSNLDS
jgi:hypothetical protein